jgi:hypothetical protein
MKLAVDFDQPFLGYMGVYLSGGNVNMPQHHLDRPQVGTAFQQMAGKGVAHAVGRYVFMKTGFQGIFANDFPKSLTGHWLAGPGDK